MRYVKKSAVNPIEVKPQEKSVFICACGLSKEQPYCDGSHSKGRKEEDGKVYFYDEQGELEKAE